MDAQLRTLLDQSKFYKGTVQQVAKLLPPSDDALQIVIAELIAASDQLGFLFVTVAAIDSGRRVDARHLEGSINLCGDARWLGNIAWKTEGDVPGALLAAMKRSAIPRELHACALFIVAAWCREAHQELPGGFMAEARRLARVKGLNASTLGYLAGVALTVEDGDFRQVLSLSYPTILTPDLIKPAEVFARASIAVFKAPVMDLVSEAPDRQLARGRPMRRAVAKLGRNDLCHCGSGKKYKRCCFDADQERLEFSSEVAGHTHAELRTEPDAGLTESRIVTMPAFELALIDPRKVPENLLRPYLMQVTGLLLLDRAVEVFEVIDWDEESIDAWNFVLFFVMKEQRKDLAERMLAARVAHAPDAEVEDRAGIRLLIARDDPAEELRVLTEIATDALGESEPEKLASFGYGVLCSHHAALGILICRSLIPLVPQKEASFLFDGILAARDRLDLPPDDPFGDVFEKRLAEEAHDEGGDAAALREARKRLDAKAAEVRQLHEEIERKRRALERQEKKQATTAQPISDTAAAAAERRDLRLKIAELKGTLNERSTERATLRRELEKARDELETARQGQAQPAPGDHSSAAEEATHEGTHYLPEQPAGNQPLRLVEYPPHFLAKLNDLPRQAARSALTMAGRLAGGELGAFAGVVALKACPGILRQRIGSDYRLLFRLHPDRVQIVDLINRRDLDRRIKSLQAAAG